MRYPVVIHKDPSSDFGVTVPDLPGCFSAGATMDEALLNVVEAIECHLEGILIDGEAAPAPKTVEQYRDNPVYAGGVWALVPVDLSKLSGKARRVNITLPERVLNILDKYAEVAGESRSGLIAQAALEYVAARSQEALPVASYPLLQARNMMSVKDRAAAPVQEGEEQGVSLEHLNRLAPQIRELARKYGIARVWVIGSVARGEASAESDVDLMVEMEPGASLFGVAGFGYDCERLLGVRVDVVPREAVGGGGESEYITDAMELI